MTAPPLLVKLRSGVLLLAVVVTFLLLIGPFVGAAYVFIIAPPWVGVLALVGAILIAGVCGRAISRAVHWVELDGDVIRERRLLTRKIIEHRVEDIVGVSPLNTDSLGEATRFLSHWGRR